MARESAPAWYSARSEAASGAWERRWERSWELGDFGKLGPKGQAYITEKYGTEVGGGPTGGGEYEEYENPFDFEIEY